MYLVVSKARMSQHLFFFSIKQNKKARLRRHVQNLSEKIKYEIIKLRVKLNIKTEE